MNQVKMSGSMLLSIGLWLLMAAGLFVFISRWSFSAILGRQFDILEIPVYLGLTSIFLIQVFGLAPYFDAKYLRFLPSVSYLPSGLLLTGTGFFSMLFGYALVSKSYKPDPTQSLNKSYDTPSLTLTFFVYVGLLFLRLGLIALGGGEMILGSTVIRVGGDSWYQWFGYLMETRWFFIALVSLQVFSGRWPRQIFIFVVLIETTMAVVSGWSSLLPKIVVLVLGCLIYARQKLPWRPLLLAVIVVIAVIIFSVPITRHLRYAGQLTFSKVNDSILATWGEGFDNGWNIFSDLMIQRQTATAQTPAILLYLIPETLPYLPWQELAVAPITFIPRVIWPSKPVYTNLGSWLMIEVFGGTEGGGSAAVTIAGNAYMYGGWFVVVIGMFIIGIVTGLFYRWFAIPGLLNNQMGLLAVYAGVVIANFHLGEGDFVSIWQGLVQRTLVFLVVAWFLCAKVGAPTIRKFS